MVVLITVIASVPNTIIILNCLLELGRWTAASKILTIFDCMMVDSILWQYYQPKVEKTIFHGLLLLLVDVKMVIYPFISTINIFHLFFDCKLALHSMFYIIFTKFMYSIILFVFLYCNIKRKIVSTSSVNVNEILIFDVVEHEYQVIFDHIWTEQLLW